MTTSKKNKKQPAAATKTPEEVYTAMLNFALEWNENNNRNLTKEEAAEEMKWKTLNQLQQRILNTAKSIRLMRKMFPDAVGEIDLMLKNSGLNGNTKGEFYQ